MRREPVVLTRYFAPGRYTLAVRLLGKRKGIEVPFEIKTGNLSKPIQVKAK